MKQFIPGLELSRLFYLEAVRPVLKADYPFLAHAAALLGPGSEVLGFDTEMSTDHNWGARLLLFLAPEDHMAWAESLHKALSHKLPYLVHGHPTHFEVAANDPSSMVPKIISSGPVNHRVHITTLPEFLQNTIGTELTGEPTLLDWLLIPEQELRSLVTGAVYHDGLNVLETMRRKLTYYPDDVWLYLLSAQWNRIGQEEAFVGRTGSVRDELGSAVIAARLVRDLMRLCFLLERTYAPYAKWFGFAFARLACADQLLPIFTNVLLATRWQEREEHLSAAYTILATMHNRLDLTPPVPTQVSPYYNRPFHVIHAGTIAQLLHQAIQEPTVRALPEGVGKVDQFVDNTDILSEPSRCRRLRTIYL